MLTETLHPGLIHMKHFYKEKWAKSLVFRCAKLVETLPKRLAAVTEKVAQGDQMQATLFSSSNSFPPFHNYI